jgi:putative Holliday junction resolvase
VADGMSFGRIMALDIGHKRTGVALSDETRLISTPHSVIETEPRRLWIEKLTQLIEENEVKEVLVGVPLNQHGEEGQDAEKILKYVAVLRERLSVPVVEWDERFSTVQAERALISADMSRKNRKQVIDKVAAAIILQGYLDTLRYKTQDSSWQDEDS